MDALDTATERLVLPHGDVVLPAFLPDATRGVVRAVDGTDLATAGVQGVVMSTFHLMMTPGSSTVQALGGLHTMAGWQGPIITDSGGFQAYSLILEDEAQGEITDRGLLFRPGGADRKFQLTPEKTVQLQVSYGADVVYCLDVCTHPDAELSLQREAVERTIDWSRRGKAEFVRLMEQKAVAPEDRPKLFAVIQGGSSDGLRRKCAEALLEVGFDGFGYGGWPLDGEGNLMVDMLTLVRRLVPSRLPLHALGIGHPQSLTQTVALGYDIFDCALPTRDARRGRLYALTRDPAAERLTGDWYSMVYVSDKRHIKDGRPISSFCDCACCRSYSLGYLHHLFKTGDCLYQRLATVHNLRFMTQLLDNLRRLIRQRVV